MGTIFSDLCGEDERKSKYNNSKKTKYPSTRASQIHRMKSGKIQKTDSYGSISPSPKKSSDQSNKNSPHARGEELRSVVSGSPYIPRRNQPIQSMRKIPEPHSSPQAAHSVSMPQLPKVNKVSLNIIIEEPADSFPIDYQNSYNPDLLDSTETHENSSDFPFSVTQETIPVDPAEFPMAENKCLELADELWLQIARFLPLVDVHQLQRVCKRFNFIFTDSLLYSQLITSQYGYSINIKNLTPLIGYNVLNYIEQRLVSNEERESIQRDITNINGMTLKYWDPLSVANNAIKKLRTKIKKIPDAPNAALKLLNKINLLAPDVVGLFILHYSLDPILIKRLKDDNLLPDYTNPDSRAYFAKHGSALFPFSVEQNFMGWIKKLLTLQHINHRDIQAVFPLLLDCMIKHFTALFDANELWAAIPIIALNLLIADDNRDFIKAFALLSTIHNYCSNLLESSSSLPILQLLLLEIGRFYPDGQTDDLCSITTPYTMLSSISDSASRISTAASLRWNGDKETQPNTNQIKTVLENYQPTFYSLKKQKPAPSLNPLTIELDSNIPLIKTFA